MNFPQLLIAQLIEANFIEHRSVLKQRTLLTKGRRKKWEQEIHSAGAFFHKHKELLIERNSHLRLEEFYNVERR